MSNAMSTLAFIKSMSAGGGGGEAESHMFLATYGTTTAAEVGVAYHANKVCYVLNSNEENLGVIVEENDTHYTFGCPKAKGTLLMSVNKTTNAWTTNFYSHYAVGGNGISVVHGEGTGATGNEETISAKVDGTTIGFDADGKLKSLSSGGNYTAGNGISITNNVISVTDVNNLAYPIFYGPDNNEKNSSWEMAYNQCIEAGDGTGEDYNDLLELTVTSSLIGLSTTPLQFMFMKSVNGLITGTPYRYLTTAFDKTFSDFIIEYIYNEDDDTGSIDITVITSDGVLKKFEKAITTPDACNLCLINIANLGPHTIDSIECSNYVCEYYNGMPLFDSSQGLIRDLYNNIIVKVDGSTISFDDDGQLVAVGGSSSEEIIIAGTNYYNKATYKRKENGNFAVAYYSYDDDTYTEYDFTYQMLHVTDFSGSITNGVLSIGHEQDYDQVKIVMTGTIDSDLTISISTKSLYKWSQVDGCYEITWSGKDSNSNLVSGSACFFANRDNGNAILTDIYVTASGANFTNATVEGTIKASK